MSGHNEISLIERNAEENKMTEKNLAIVFVPALALSNAQLFRLFLTEQDVFFRFVPLSLLQPLSLGSAATR